MIPPSIHNAHLIQILECLIKLGMPGDEIPFSEAEARAPFSFLGDQTVALCDNIFSNKQLLSRPVPFRYVLHRETVKEKDGKIAKSKNVKENKTVYNNIVKEL